MSEYIHHVSGRLRLKLTQIRRQPARAQEVQTATCRIRGVTSVETNTVTGSLLIRYDADVVEVGMILNSMKEMGLLSSVEGASRGLQSHASSASSSPLTDKVVDVLLEKLIERSAIALVGALL